MGTIQLIKLRTNWRTEGRRFARYMAVGISGTLLDFAILSALKYFLGWPTLPANVISYSCGILNNYLLSRCWVYPDARAKQRSVQMLQFILVSLVGLVLNNILVLVLEGPAGTLLPNPAYGYIPAKVVATLAVFVWNFIANRFWTFDPIKPKDDARHTEWSNRPAA